MKKFFKIIFGLLLLLLIVLYLGIVFLLPKIINNKSIISSLQSVILEKTGTETSITGLNLKIYPNLTVNLKLDSLDAKNNNITAANIKNLSIRCELLQKHPALVSADNIFIDGNHFKQFKRGKKEGKKRVKFEPSDIPEFHIQKLVFKSDEVGINAENIETNDNYITLNLKINSKFLKVPLILGNSGTLQIKENKLLANNFKVTLGNSILYLDGIIFDKNQNPNLDIKGEKLPVSELVPIVLHVQKTIEPCKKLIENFKDFKGTVNVDLKFNKDGLWGTCVANNVGASDVMFSVPSFFKEIVINFKGQTADSKSEGILGNEKVVQTLNITDLLTSEKEVIGTVNTTLTKKFNYVPNLKVLNNVNINVAYKLKYRKPEVFANIDIPAKSDLIYDSFYLGLRDYKRTIYANTFKDGDIVYLKKCKYSYSDSKKESIILAGDGLFIKNIDKKDPDKYIPQFLTIRTNGYAPISVIGSFGEKVRGGEFKGDLKYDFKNNQLLGTFDIIKASLKDFRIEQAHVISKNGIFKITSNGFYKGEKYLAELSTKNNIFGETLIYNMKLFMDKLILDTIQNEPKKEEKTDSTDFSKKVKDFDMTINNWEISIKEIVRDKLILQNVNLLGSMKNDVFNFTMKDMNFADGVIRADGVYDFGKDCSKMKFEAENINSNKVAKMTLNLKDQIEGTAKAKLDIDSKNMFKFLDAHCMFEVKEGYMPKLGDTEFMMKNSKYKLSDIINIDLSQKDLMKDDIKGTFDVHNTELKNINITTWHEMSSMFLKGSYEIEKQYADLQLFWKYSKEAPKGIKIFGIPFSLILKVAFSPEYSKEKYQNELSKVPAIKADKKNTSCYRIQLNGDINNNKIDLKLKEIR